VCSGATGSNIRLMSSNPIESKRTPVPWRHASLFSSLPSPYSTTSGQLLVTSLFRASSNSSLLCNVAMFPPAPCPDRTSRSVSAREDNACENVSISSNRGVVSVLTTGRMVPVRFISTECSASRRMTRAVSTFR